MGGNSFGRSASLARLAGDDLRLLQKTMGHASITATAHNLQISTTANSVMWLLF